MGKIRVGMTGMVLAMLPFIAAHAEDPRCKAPPYGGTEAGFRSFAQTFGTLVTPARVLSVVCDAKFGGDRTALYNLGFTDADINALDTADLAVQMLGAIRNIARHSN
jgi:hypothetical protein